MPQLWEQLNHKYDERRILVAETCAVILPHIPSALTSSLVFSMLQQLGMEDKCLQVRLSAISSLSILVLYLRQDSNKQELISEMLKTMLQDPSQEIVQVVQGQFLQSVLKWYLDNDFEITDLLESQLQELSTYCDLMEDLEETDNSKIIQKIKTVTKVFPFMIATLIKTMPNSDKIDIPEHDNELLKMILEGHTDNNLSDLKAMFQKEWYESWKSLEWFKTTWIIIVIQSLAKVPGPTDKLIIEAFEELFDTHVNYLGNQFVRDHISPKFKQYLPPPMLDTQPEFSVQEVQTYQSCLVPVYVQGVLAKVDPPTDLADKIQDLAIAYCTNPALNSWPISTSIQSIISQNLDPGYRDAIAEMAWTLLVHPASGVKIMASLTLQYLAENQGLADLDLVGHKILPGLVTLSSDPDPQVRSSALTGLAQVIVASKSSMETREKAAFQLVSFISQDHEQNILVQKSAIEAIGQIVIKDTCPHKLRDDLFLPKLSDFINGQR